MCFLFLAVYDWVRDWAKHLAVKLGCATWNTRAYIVNDVLIENCERHSTRIRHKGIYPQRRFPVDEIALIIIAKAYAMSLWWNKSNWKLLLKQPFTMLAVSSGPGFSMMLSTVKVMQLDLIVHKINLYYKNILICITNKFSWSNSIVNIQSISTISILTITLRVWAVEPLANVYE